MTNLIKFNKQVLRKLDGKEMALLKRGWGDNMFVKLQIRSKVNLFEKHNLPIFKLAIKEWMKSEKFLCSKITKNNENDYFYEYHDQIDYNFENVEFLCTNKSTRLVSKLLTNDMISQRFDLNKNQDTLLWKYYFLEVDPKENVYDIIALFHQTISQGKAGFLSICKLLKIFEYLHKKDQLPLDYNKPDVFPGCDKLFEFAKTYDTTPNVDPVKRPSFIDPHRARTKSLSESNFSDLDPNTTLVRVQTNKIFKSIPDLIETSRLNHIKLSKFGLEQNQFNSFKNECRKNGVKLTGALEVISCLVIKELYEKRNAHEEESLQLAYFTVISNRNANKDHKVDDEAMGLCTGGLITSADISDIDQLIRNKHRIKETFWPIAKKWSDKIHDRLKNDKTRFFPKPKPTKNDEMNYQFLLSNIGDLGETSFGYFCVRDVAFWSSFQPDACMRLFASYPFTFDNGTKFKWVVMYNSHFIDTEIVEQLISIVSRVFNDICSEN